MARRLSDGSPIELSLVDGRAVPNPQHNTAKLAAVRAARLLGGVLLGVTGLAVTGGSFGLFAAIGIPIMAVGLSLISSEVNRDGRQPPPRPVVVATSGPSAAPVTMAAVPALEAGDVYERNRRAAMATPWPTMPPTSEPTSASPG